MIRAFAAGGSELRPFAGERGVRPPRDGGSSAGPVSGVARRDGAMFDLLVRQALTQSELVASDQEVGPRVIALYSRFLRAGIESGELRPGLDLELVSLVIGDLWTGTILEWSFGGRSFALARRLEDKLDLLFDGLCASRGRRSA